MKIYLKILLAAVFLVHIVLSKRISKSYIPNTEEYPKGRWETKTEWKEKLVKEWVIKKMYVPYWKKVWSPVEVREWIPYPSPPPGWSKSIRM